MNLIQAIRCHVRVLDRYFQVLPHGTILNDESYLQPLGQVSSNPSQPWFKMTPVGKKTPGTMVRRICDGAGISESLQIIAFMCMV